MHSFWQMSREDQRAYQEHVCVIGLTKAHLEGTATDPRGADPNAQASLEAAARHSILDAARAGGPLLGVERYRCRLKSRREKTWMVKGDSGNGGMQSAVGSRATPAPD
jgi:hypothetical protein